MKDSNLASHPYLKHGLDKKQLRRRENELLYKIGKLREENKNLKRLLENLYYYHTNEFNSNSRIHISIIEETKQVLGEK